MSLKQQMTRMVPAFLERAYCIRREMNALNRVQRLQCDVKNLCPRSKIRFNEVFNCRDTEFRWKEFIQKANAFGTPDGTGGVNPGDRKALYYLISSLQPSSVLEIGTHIGASTLSIASALFTNSLEHARQVSLTTLDIRDVNSPISKPWLKFGANKSPGEMVHELGLGAFVEFVTGTSVNYLAECGRRFDFIFLDGDHSAKTAYQEIPAALSLLNQNGVILLHDYYPKLKPLWSDGSVIPGPFLATERLAKESANLVVLPLGELPWSTKLHSNVTSLALLLRND